MSRDRIIIATVHPWNIRNAREAGNRMAGRYQVEIVTDPAELASADLGPNPPRFIFFPHWSWKIPAEIAERYECILFHISDLPFGRGGTPLQNLISRGMETTVISAIRVTEEIDAGPVYLKHPLSLCGNAEEIYLRASGIIFGEMIPEILKKRPKPRAQRGKVTRFSRRRPEESNIKGIHDLENLYDHIRMLDAPGYPKAYLETEHLIVELTRASVHTDGIRADAWIRIKREGGHEENTRRGSTPRR